MTRDTSAAKSAKGRLSPHCCESTVCAVIGRTDPRLRLRRIAGDVLDVATGELMLLDNEHETLAARVIGTPEAEVLEIETLADLDGRPKTLTVRRSRGIGRAA